MRSVPESAESPHAAPSDVAAATRISIVILTWNGRDDTLACLRSLLPQLGTDDHVHLVDNASTDGTEDAVREAFPQLDILRNGANLGFAGGNNPGLCRALDDGADWVLLLNNDTELPDGALDALRLHARDAEPDVGVLQPVLVSANAPDRIDSAGHRLHPRPGVSDIAAGRRIDILPEQPLAVFGACGAAALIRRTALERAGLLDDALFVLFEDVDLMFRIRTHGFDVQLVPSVRIRHRRGVSGSPRSAQRRFWAQRNIVALALRWWPLRALCVGSPSLLYRALHALGLGLRHDVGRCAPLWWGALRARRANRAAMRRYGVDAWFGRRPLA